MSVESASLDALDKALVRCLQVAPRAAFSLYAAVLGTSEQTVARRYRRLRTDGVVRVTAVLSTEALGQSNWVVRIQCKPSGTASLAQALAKRDDVGWVSISGGAAEVVCVVRSRTAAAREDLLLERLARTAPVLGVSAAMTLHPFLAGRADDWAGLQHELTAEQERRLRATAGGEETIAPAVLTELNPGDQAILDRLVVDGRSTYAQLAAAAGITEGRAARRLHFLLSLGVAHLDLDISAEAFGWDVSAQLWMTAAPADLEACGQALARIPGVTFAAAITGPHNLMAAVVCRDHQDLYRLVTRQVGAVPGISTLEVSPRMRTVKQAGALVEHSRLAN
ncbi:Lrp/AsnC family transcriptional regulator [Allobranchiibius sp. CTAmp26]|uniref:Lrp/AsnC family transcriptional regulator n=1 Tax=Allobranchiibius sp. CTAmp26 TaxID=2815214 RepID=UPI001AA0B5A9|nr:Lrp/AsnC family transcriptional regulator [Allobranchiibius sp. CTAmp26]MBO1754877.1 Lrp/AsnC family transcriptional regulator [Allobranchiibius sp. CTAmp26]